MARAFDIDACMMVVLTPSGADSGADAVNGSAAKPKKPAAQNASRAPVPYLRLLCWLRRVFDRRPILVGAAYIFSFIPAPLVRPVFRVIHLQFAVDDGESLRINCIFVAALVCNAHGAMPIILSGIFFWICQEEIEVLFVGKLPARIMPDSLVVETTRNCLSDSKISNSVIAANC
jgi:hypothetical protein